MNAQQRKAAFRACLRQTWAAATDIAESGRPVTLRGLMARTGTSSTSSIGYRVDKLIALGYLAWDWAVYEDRRVLGGLKVILPLGTYRRGDITRRKA